MKEKQATGSGLIGQDSNLDQTLADLLRFKQEASARKDEIQQALGIQQRYEKEAVDLQKQIDDAKTRMLEKPVSSSSVGDLKEQIAEHNVCL